MMEMEELKEELRQLRVSFREDLRQEFRTQEAKLKELLKGQAVVAQSPGWSNSNAPSKDLSDLAEELDLHDEFLLPPGVPHLEGAGAALARQHSPGTAWVGSSTNKEDWRKLLSVTPEQSGPTALEQDLPGLVGDPHPPPEKDRKKEKRHSILKQGKDKDDEFKDIRMKGGVFGAGNDKDLRLDEDVYDVRNFYKKTGCAQAVARSDRFERLTLMVISINAVYIGVDADNNNASSMVDAAWPYVVFDNMFCAFFTAELLIRFGAFAVKRNCLKDRWFVFDSLLVALMVAETWVLTIVVLAMGSMEGGMPTGPLRLLRLLRLSRLVRLLKAMPELLTLINGMRVAARAVSSALLLVILLNYVFAIVLLMVLEDREEMKENFGTLGECMYTLIMDGTFMDSTRDVLGSLRTMDNDGLQGWVSISVFLIYVLLTNITVMNMLIGIVCEVVSEVKREDEEGVAIDFMKEHLRTMLTDLDQDKNENISKSELQSVVEDEKAKVVLSELQVKPEDVIDLTEYLFEQDEDAGREQEVTREELLEVILKIRGGRTISNQDIIDVRCDIRRIVQRQTNMVLREVSYLQRCLTEVVHRTGGMLPSPRPSHRGPAVTVAPPTEVPTAQAST